jgi:uncharacterized membrane protein
MKGASARLGLAAAIAAGGVIACSSSSNDGTGGSASACISAPACPDGGPPSYKTEIAPILQEDCIPCHSPTGPAGFDMTTYADVSGESGSILSQVTVCRMPPSNGPTMTDAQRIALTAWLRCGAPDN